VVEIYRRFRGVYCPHHQGALMALTMEAVNTFETPVNLYHTTRRNIAEDYHIHKLRRKALKSHDFDCGFLGYISHCVTTQETIVNKYIGSISLLATCGHTVKTIIPLIYCPHTVQKKMSFGNAYFPCNSFRCELHPYQ
jgi:hypothetical protein